MISPKKFKFFMLAVSIIIALVLCVQLTVLAEEEISDQNNYGKKTYFEFIMDLNHAVLGGVTPITDPEITITVRDVVIAMRYQLALPLSDDQIERLEKLLDNCRYEIVPYPPMPIVEPDNEQ